MPRTVMTKGEAICILLAAMFHSAKHTPPHYSFAEEKQVIRALEVLRHSMTITEEERGGIKAIMEL